MEVFSNGIQLELFNTILILEILQQKEGLSRHKLHQRPKFRVQILKKETKKFQNLAYILKRGTSWNKLEPPEMS